MINVSNDYKTKIYGQTRKFDARFTLNVPGFINNVTYYDDRIMEININEENTPLSDILPTNQMDVKLDNRDGTFNFLTYQNMPTILANRPTMFAEVGLVTAEILTAQSVPGDFVGKVSGSTVVNPNLYKARASDTALVPPSSFVSEQAQGSYDNIATLNGVTSTTSASTNLTIAEQLFQFDVIQLIERTFGVGIWGGRTALVDKIAFVPTLVSNITCTHQGFGTNPTGNKLNLRRWARNGAGGSFSWNGGSSHTNGTVTSLTNVFDENFGATARIFEALDTNGFVNFLAYTDASNGTIPSVVQTDKVSITITMKPQTVNEWTPFGYAFLDNWQSDFELQTVTLFGHDWFEQLINVPFAPATYSNMTLLIQAIMTTAGITNYSIDPIIGTNFTTPRTVPALTNCRALLQLIGIVTMCAVYQDRTGKVVIKPFPSLQNNGMYTTFATTNTGGQRGIWQYAGNGGNVPYTPYEEVNDDGGNRHIQLKDMYELPRVSLEKSIYKIVVNVYNTTGASINHTNTYTNGTIGGANGISFEMNNYLIYTDSEAQNVANYFFSESNYNVEYTSNWRQNPSIECGDLVLFDDGMPVGGVPGTTSNKVTRIYKQDFYYDGALSGTTEGRGGL